MNEDPIIPRKYMYTIKWTQPYATQYQRPYMRSMQESVERAIEAQLERKEWPQAKQVIERIMKL
jgi:hypothetical protein